LVEIRELVRHSAWAASCCASQQRSYGAFRIHGIQATTDEAASAIPSDDANGNVRGVLTRERAELIEQSLGQIGC
jgi:hypothetical protein